MNLRRREKQPVSGFIKAEVDPMEQLLKVFKGKSLVTDTDFFKSLDTDFFEVLEKVFNGSINRAGKPTLKCSLTRQETSSDEAKEIHVPDSLYDHSEAATGNPKIPAGPKSKDLLTREFEAKSSTDGAWYDVENFLSHKLLSSEDGDIEVRVRFLGFGPEDDEWVHVKNNVRQRSIAFEPSDCRKLMLKDPVLCFQERQDQAKYYDAQVISIKRRMHDGRGCRCLFLIKYDHDGSQEEVQLDNLYCRPAWA